MGVVITRVHGAGCAQQWVLLPAASHRPELVGNKCPPPHGYTVTRSRGDLLVFLYAPKLGI